MRGFKHTMRGCILAAAAKQCQAALFRIHAAAVEYGKRMLPAVALVVNGLSQRNFFRSLRAYDQKRCI